MTLFGGLWLVVEFHWRWSATNGVTSFSSNCVRLFFCSLGNLWAFGENIDGAKCVPIISTSPTHRDIKLDLLNCIFMATSIPTMV